MTLSFLEFTVENIAMDFQKEAAKKENLVVRAGGTAQLRGCLSRIQEALSLIPTMT